ncbi:MAG: phage tail sheath subtilisin-like domain-containing protein [Lachnospiraceae bacterium]|nr:phage tail sheath subtilisin-like domain-containing protein [Lachnospiraceae bacterium]MCM1240975.1 phage tail sheath subtilisin-like domain-containing protein [Lachnospiraceae bacterium]
MALGLPSFSMVFSGKAMSAIERSARGIVACILRDGTEGGREVTVYKKVDEIDFEHWSEQNHNYLKLVFAGAPSSVIAVRQASGTEGHDASLKKLKGLKWNYLCIPGLEASDVPMVAAWIKQYRNDEKKTYKAVLPHCRGDHEGIINFTTEGITSTITGRKHSAAEYCARIAGILAGLSLARSSTYFVLDDISSAAVPDDPSARIDEGEMVIIFDGKKYKIARGVNSLVTFTAEKTEDVRFVKIVEGMDLYMDDIRETYEENYVGRIINDYDGKQRLVAAIGAYHKGLLGNVLDRSFDNSVTVDVEAQRTYLESKGIDTSGMDDIAIAKANTGTKVFLRSNVKFVNAMEDLTMGVSM